MIPAITGILEGKVVSGFREPVLGVKDRLNNAIFRGSDPSRITGLMLLPYSGSVSTAQTASISGFPLKDCVREPLIKSAVP